MHIVRSEGFRALWRGNLCACMHRFPMVGIQFSVFDACQRRHLLGGNPFFAGCLGSSIAVLICYPLDLARTRLMASTRSAGDGARPGALIVLRSSLQRDGPLGIYRGMGTSMLVSLPQNTVTLAAYVPMKCWLREACSGSSDAAVAALAGGISGTVGATLVFPVDLLRRRLQIMGSGPGIPQRSLVQEARNMLGNEGPRGFWRGFGPEMLKVFPSASLLFVVFEQLKAVPEAMILYANSRQQQ